MFITLVLRITFLTTLIGLTVSCTTTATSSSDTFVRISNQSGVALSRLHLGRRIIKANSYSNKNYISSFGKVNSGDITGYRALKKSHFGLDRFLVTAGRGGYTQMTRFLPIDAKNLQEALQRTYGLEVTSKHPFSRKEVTGYVLPPGKYTFTITLDKSVAEQQPCRPRPDGVACERGFILEIQRDDDGS